MCKHTVGVKKNLWLKTYGVKRRRFCQIWIMLFINTAYKVFFLLVVDKRECVSIESDLSHGFCSGCTFKYNRDSTNQAGKYLDYDW
jgi:hypothetical protein